MTASDEATKFYTRNSTGMEVIKNNILLLDINIYFEIGGLLPSVFLFDISRFSILSGIV